MKNQRMMQMLLLTFAFALFTSACLLFWIQPLLAKMVLPYLGGSPAVWNTCMMFFQGVLLVGYIYAHLLAKIPRKLQAVMHITLLCIGIFFLPFVVHPERITSYQSPITTLVSFLIVIAAAPLIAISASAPLFQRWFSDTNHPHAKDPYFLYTASNAGSLVALLAFPFFLEPLFTLTHQNKLWSTGFIGLIILAVACAICMLSVKEKTTDTAPSELSNHITFGRRFYWIALTFAPSSILLGVTTYITTDIASVPLFWVLPLALYLLSFIIVFARKPILKQTTSQSIQIALLFPFFLIMTFSMSYLFHTWKLAIHLLLFFFTAVVCHAELVKTRPHHEKLTEFYLLIAAGGFLGGVFNTIIAPLIFIDTFEYPVVLFFAVALVPPKYFSRKVMIPALVLLLVASVYLENPYYRNSIYTVRNFFGTTRVVKFNDEVHYLLHGTTTHGLQLRENSKQTAIRSYYIPLVTLFKNLHLSNRPLNVGIAGLGAGSCACLADPSDKITFYEIDSDIVDIANNEKYFSFLKLCPPKGGVIIGDARLKLQKALNHSYDVLILDAFSSDAIPVHLMTLEAMQLYFNKLKDKGLLLMNISNRHLDLTSVASALAEKLSLQGRYTISPADLKKHIYRSTWVILAKKNVDLSHLTLAQNWKPLPKPILSHLWTDDYSNIVRELR